MWFVAASVALLPRVPGSLTCSDVWGVDVSSRVFNRDGDVTVSSAILGQWRTYLENSSKHLPENQMEKVFLPYTQWWVIFLCFLFEKTIL